jgi:hypothetical protein
MSLGSWERERRKCSVLKKFPLGIKKALETRKMKFFLAPGL